MSRLDELLSKLCPEGVETKALGIVGTVVRGKRFVKADMINAGVPCIHYGEIYTRYGVSASQSYSFVSKDRARTLRFAQPGDVILASAGETVKDIGKSVAWLGTEPIAIHDACYSFSSSMDPTFVSYFFASRAFRDQIKQQISSSKISSISTQNVAKARIPVPPIEVQREIVSILNELTLSEASLEAELDTELAARHRQYDHYRTLLLFPAGAGTAKLGDIATFKYGFTAKAQPTGDLRFLRITDISPAGQLNAEGAKYVSGVGGASDYIVEPGDLLMARTGATFGKTMLVEEDAPPAVYASFLIRIRVDASRVLPRYYWHFAQSVHYWSQANAMVSMGGQPQFNANVLKRVEVPILPLSQQREIVEKLDAFEAVMNELSIALPAELQARRKQYEYYRNRLLTFKEASA